MQNKKSWWQWPWVTFKKEETLPDPPKYLIIPKSDYPNTEDWKLETHQELYLQKLDSYYFYEIVKTTHAFAKGKESKETLIQLTAKHALIKQLLEN